MRPIRGGTFISRTVSLLIGEHDIVPLCQYYLSSNVIYKIDGFIGVMELVECINPRTGKPYCGRGLCCSDNFFVELTKADLKRLSSSFNLDEITTVKSGVTILKQSGGGCVFFDRLTRQCTIHDKMTSQGELLEPIECRIFPLVFKDKVVCANPKCPGMRVLADSNMKAELSELHQKYEQELEE